MAHDILIVDDEEDIRELISGILEDEGYETRTAFDADSAIDAVKARVPSLVVLDIWLQGSRLDGLETLSELKAKHPDLPVVIISGHGNIETAVAAIRRGAYDFIEKPFKADQLILVVERAAETADLRRENLELKRLAGQQKEIMGNSQVIQQLKRDLEKVAPTNSRILLMGPSGAGKETAARMLHQMSHRAAGPFVCLNATAMDPAGLDEELFGIEGKRVGTFERAHGGTLFIDEIADMTPETQSKILRALVAQTFTRVGGDTQVRIDVRVVSASNRDLQAEIEGGTFREDLYHRLAVVPLQVPALRDRRDDIPMLLKHFMSVQAQSAGLPEKPITEEAMAALQAYDWPGNVRQLRNIAERLLITELPEGAEAIEPGDLPAELSVLSPESMGSSSGSAIMSLPLREARELFEREYLMAQISRFGGNVSRTAAFVGMERSALHRKLKALGLTETNKQTA